MSKIIEIAAIDVTIYKFVAPLMDRLRSEGFEIIAAANESGYGQKLEECGYDVHRIDFVRNLSPLKNLLALFQLIKLFRIEKPDIIHTHTPIASFLARIAAKTVAKKAKVIYTLHGLNEQPLFLLAEYLACKYMTEYVFTVNKEDMKYLIRHKFITKDKISYLNSIGVNTDRYNVENVSRDEKQKLKNSFNINNAPVIGFVGRPVDIKGFGELVDAFIIVRRRTDCKLLVVGSTFLSERDTETLTKAKKRLNASGFAGDVIFAGRRDDIPEIMSLMDIFVHPSKWEGMCISILEAMSMELPVIGTDIRGIREEITEKTGVLVQPGDVKAIAAAMELLLKDEAKRKRMGKNGRKRAVKYFNEKIAVESQTTVFKSIL